MTKRERLAWRQRGFGDGSKGNESGLELARTAGKAALASYQEGLRIGKRERAA